MSKNAEHNLFTGYFYFFIWKQSIRLYIYWLGYLFL